MAFLKKSKKNFLNKKIFAVYGLGTTGKSVVNFFVKKKLRNFSIWDDNKRTRNFFEESKKYNKKSFEKNLDKAHWIILSPGINIEKSKLKKKLIKNRHKIITDLDLFYILNPNVKSVVITGSNGKSTTCKIIEHMLKKNKINAQAAGNIGKPILNLNVKKNTLVVIEASSFQLEYSQFIKASYAMILNISNDHLDWHKTMKNYIKSKFKIFLNQKKNDFAFINSKRFKNFYKNNNFKAKLKIVSVNNYSKVRKKIKNIYLTSKINDENMSFAYELAKKFNISDKSFIKALNSFKGLDHRHEIFYKKKSITFINDSKATNFEASRHALINNKNIYWIVGGQAKKNDHFYLKNLKKKIKKAYIVGKNSEFFKKQIQNYIPYTISKNIKNAIRSIINDIKFHKNLKKTVLLSPAAASFDQFENFEDRGVYFKKLILKKFKWY